MRKFLFLALILSLSAQAAPTLTFTANTVTSNGSVVPVLSWSTNPAASSCTGSGDWAGAKAPAGGSETLPLISTSKSYTLACSWNDGQAALTWVNSTLRTDNSPLTNLKETRINYGSTPATLNQSVLVPAPGTTKIVAPLTAGTWYFTAQAGDATGVYSIATSPVTKVVSLSNTTQQVAITINPLPMPPTNLTVQ